MRKLRILIAGQLSTQLQKYYQDNAKEKGRKNTSSKSLKTDRFPEQTHTVGSSMSQYSEISIAESLRKLKSFANIVSELEDYQ